MSCSVCTCTHHAAIHDTSGEGIGACQAQGGCDCREFALLSVLNWQRRQTAVSTPEEIRRALAGPGEPTPTPPGGWTPENVGPELRRLTLAARPIVIPLPPAGG